MKFHDCRDSPGAVMQRFRFVQFTSFVLYPPPPFRFFFRVLSLFVEFPLSRCYSVLFTSGIWTLCDNGWGSARVRQSIDN